MQAPDGIAKRWRVVLDTNVLISGIRFGGKPEAILELAGCEAFILLTSKPLKNELVRVLTIKFHMPRQLIAETCARLWEVSECIDPQIRLDLCPDEADNRVIECAIEGNAGYIVTGDRHLLNMQPIEGLAILTPDAFLAQFHASGTAS
jgi:putative PIN family toxin of toxin-antitoxin system